MDNIEIKKLKDSLVAAMHRNRAQGVRVTIESFVAAAELVKEDKAEVIEVAGQLFIRIPY
jgi:hypothetical protein